MVGHFGSFWDLTESPKISFVRSSGGTVDKINTFSRFVEKGQIYDDNISTALLIKNKAFLSTEIRLKIWIFPQNSKYWIGSWDQ